MPSCFTEQKRNDLITETETLIDGLIYKGAVDKVSVLEAHKFLSSSVRHLVRYDGVLSFLDLLNTHSKNVYAHGVGVSLYSLILANKTFRYSSPELFKLALVGFFINCGKKEISADLFSRDYSALTDVEKTQIMSHTARARDILAAIKFLPEDVVQIIYDCLDASEGRSHGRLGPLSAASFASYQFMNYMGESGTDELEPRMNQALAKMKESGQDHVGDYAVALENVLFGVDSKI